MEQKKLHPCATAYRLRTLQHAGAVAATDARFSRGCYRKLELVINLFEPSVKLQSKRRDGAKVHKVYEAPMTPLQRLVANYRAQGVWLPAKVAALLREQKTPDIFELNAELATELEKLHALSAHHHSTRKEAQQCEQKTKIPA